MFVVGDSVSGTSSNWPGLFATKLAQKYPTYNVKHCQYDNGNSRYGAWANLVANGTERYLAIASGKTPPANQ